MADPIPADLAQAFDEAVSAFVDWKGGDEPTVNVHGKPTPISAIANLCETYKDTMPTKLYWRMVHHANTSPDRRPQAVALSKDSTYGTGAWCLLQWIQI
jgi:hypothetical protein